MYCCDTIFPIQAAIRISIFRPGPDERFQFLVHLPFALS